MLQTFPEREIRYHPEIAARELGPDGPGALAIQRFIGGRALEGLQMEACDPDRMPFWDAHTSYYNRRGLLIIQNHDVFALKVSKGDQVPFGRIGHSVSAMRRVTDFVRGLSPRCQILPPGRRMNCRCINTTHRS